MTISRIAILCLALAPAANAQTPAAKPATPPAAKLSPLPPASTPNGGSALPAGTQVAFPGQYSPPPGDRLRPSNPKACRGLASEAHRAACFENVAFDWPGLGRFAAANRELAPRPARERRVVFFGDSITDNWSRATFGGFFPGKPYVNRGIGGQTSGQMLARFRPDVVALQPKAVVILAGTNDVSGNVGPLSPEIIEGYLTSLAELGKAAGIKVILASLLPVRDGMKNAEGQTVIRTKDRPLETLQSINHWMSDYARKNHHVYLDYATALADETGALKAELTFDGLHPNAAGYGVMGTLAEAAIIKAIGK